jgi:hypothetical protein
LWNEELNYEGLRQIYIKKGEFKGGCRKATPSQYRGSLMKRVALL